MPQRSAGILMYRRKSGAVEVLLVHPGGPFWKKKDEGAWSIPKGLYGGSEDALAAARREFEEETGAAPAGEFIPLGEFRQSSAKIVSVWAVEGEFDVTKLTSNTFALEWPPKSGKINDFPEIGGESLRSSAANGRPGGLNCPNPVAFLNRRSHANTNQRLHD
jgi:predicted NUDIX family NTP pyrophosphohydrolase